jgi:two-component system nitrogen regulation response regulator GlnG
MSSHPTPQAKGLSGMMEQFLKDFFDTHEGVVPVSGLYHTVMAEIEKPLLSMTLQNSQGNQKKAAQILGINRNTLRRKLTELNIETK